ncbi:MFS transporter [Micromonospora sp. NPDC000207]|uniref:MFS transporter n=1 Tax=Micromonospora sp. NPDC000207 TaxID=3154246 RepID=UPI00333171F0
MALDAPAPVGDRLYAPPLRAMTVGSVALVSLLAFEALAVGTAMPTVARALDGLALYGLAFGGTFAAGVIAMVVAGIWCDSRGPAAPIRHGVGWFLVGLVIAGTAQTMHLVVVGRMVQGIGGGLLIVAIYVTVGQAYPEQLRPRMFAAFAAAWVVPSLVGPAVAGLVVEHLGWRWVFLAVPVLALPAALLVERGLRGVGPAAPGETATDARARIAWACVAGVSAALLHYGGQQRGAHAVIVVGAALVGLAVAVPRLLPVGFLRAARGLPAVIGLRGLCAAAFASSEVVIPLMLSRERGFSPTAAGMVLTVGAVSWSLGSWAQGRMPPPRSRATLPRIGMTVMTLGTATVAVAVLPQVPVAVGVIGWALAGLGTGLTFPSLSVLTLALSRPGEQGRNSSSLQLGDNLCTAVVLALTGTVLAAGAAPGTGTYLAMLSVAVGCALLGALLAGRVVPTPVT